MNEIAGLVLLAAILLGNGLCISIIVGSYLAQVTNSTRYYTAPLSRPIGDTFSQL